MVLNTSLFHYTVGDMANAYLAVYREILSCNGTMPNIMIPFAMADKIAPLLQENLPDFFFVFCH
ncbi:MAG: hypothetical protein FWC45_05170 [Treponema sp.]|nr:hypothetical protein [Treponema sp.]